MTNQIPIREYEVAVYVYWLGPNLPTVKIGHTDDPASRLRTFRRETGTPGHKGAFAAIVWLDRRREAVEHEAHRILAAKRRDGEWFSASAAEALDAIVQGARSLNIRFEIEDRADITGSRDRRLAVTAILRLMYSIMMHRIKTATPDEHLNNICNQFPALSHHIRSHSGLVTEIEHVIKWQFDHRPDYLRDQGCLIGWQETTHEFIGPQAQSEAEDSSEIELTTQIDLYARTHRTMAPHCLSAPSRYTRCVKRNFMKSLISASWNWRPNEKLPGVPARSQDEPNRKLHRVRNSKPRGSDVKPSPGKLPTGCAVKPLKRHAVKKEALDAAQRKSFWRRAAAVSFAIFVLWA